MLRRNREQSVDDSQRIPLYKRQACLGDACAYFSGVECQSRLELLEATGDSAGVDKAPLREDCRFALYGQVCTGGDEQVVVGLHSESPNGQASATELVGRSGRHDGRRIVLTTPPESIHFDE